nr:MAG TPA: hypothetical protein [Caudoviricetes sp.]
MFLCLFLRYSCFFVSCFLSLCLFLLLTRFYFFAYIVYIFKYIM